MPGSACVRVILCRLVKGTSCLPWWCVPELRSVGRGCGPWTISCERRH